MTFTYALIRSLRGALTVLVLLSLVFVILRLSGDPLDALLGDEADPELVAYYTALYGLDRPIWQQYLRYFGGLMQGDFGFSYRDGRDALEVVLERVPATLQLGLTAIAFGLFLSIPLGILGALYRDSPLDRCTMAFAVFGFSLPNFFLGILLILLFTMTLQMLPSSGSGSWRHMVMPVLTLGTSSAGSIARFARSSMLEVLPKPYMITAAAKGITRPRRITWHALPNAAIPLVTILGFRIGDIIAGAVVVEAVFAWPGVGRLLVSSVSSRDLAIVQTIVILVTLTMVLTNLLVDLAYGWIDPRLRTERKGK